MTDLPKGWVSGTVTIDGKPILAQVKLLYGDMKVEPFG